MQLWQSRNLNFLKKCSPLATLIAALQTNLRKLTLIMQLMYLLIHKFWNYFPNLFNTLIPIAEK